MRRAHPFPERCFEWISSPRSFHSHTELIVFIRDSERVLFHPAPGGREGLHAVF